MQASDGSLSSLCSPFPKVKKPLQISPCITTTITRRLIKFRSHVVARDDFLARRQVLFAKLEAQMRSFARYGTGLRNEGSIKKMLGISTRSYLHTGEINRYAETIAKISKTAKLLKHGTPLGIALSTTATALEIKEACSTGREEQCTKAKYVEVGKLGTGVVGGSVGGIAGAALCVAVLGASTGPGALACLLISGGIGGATGGYFGGLGGEKVGKYLYEY